MENELLTLIEVLQLRIIQLEEHVLTRSCDNCHTHESDCQYCDEYSLTHWTRSMSGERHE